MCDLRCCVRSHMLISTWPHVWHSLILSDNGFVCLTHAARHIQILIKDLQYCCSAGYNNIRGDITFQHQKDRKSCVVNHYLTDSPIIQLLNYLTTAKITQGTLQMWEDLPECPLCLMSVVLLFECLWNRSNSTTAFGDVGVHHTWPTR